MGLLEKSGAWFNYGATRLGQGRENAKEFLRQNLDIREELDSQIRESIAAFQSDAAPVPAI
jgi:recombination protein RecA